MISKKFKQYVNEIKQHKNNLTYLEYISVKIEDQYRNDEGSLSKDECSLLFSIIHTYYNFLILENNDIEDIYDCVCKKFHLKSDGI